MHSHERLLVTVSFRQIAWCCQSAANSFLSHRMPLPIGNALIKPLFSVRSTLLPISNNFFLQIPQSNTAKEATCVILI